jgi:integrase
MKMTARTVATLALESNESERIVWDDDLPGLGLRMRVGGSRNWVFQYKVGDKQRRMTLGALSAMPLVKVRETAGELYAKVKLGQDPAAAKEEAKANATETFEPIARQYLARKEGSVRSRYHHEIERYLLVNSKPLHGMAIAGITRRNIAVLLEDHSDSVASQLRATLSAFFTWTMKGGLTETNPVTATNRTQPKKRKRVLSTEEIRKVWAVLEGDYKDIVRLLLLTGQRREEIGKLCWSEIDFGKGLITLSPERTKNKHEHVIPMSEQVKAILKGRNLIAGRDLVFGYGKGGFSEWSRAKKKIDDRIAIPAWRLHDIRRTVATGMANDIEILPHIIEAVLNHTSGHKAGVAGIYNHATYLKEKTEALNKWAAHLLGVVA